MENRENVLLSPCATRLAPFSSSLHSHSSSVLSLAWAGELPSSSGLWRKPCQADSNNFSFSLCSFGCPVFALCYLTHTHSHVHMVAQTLFFSSPVLYFQFVIMWPVCFCPSQKGMRGKKTCFHKMLNST